MAKASRDDVLTGSLATSELSSRVRAAYIDERLRVLQAVDKRITKYDPGPWWDGGLAKRGEKAVMRKSIWKQAAKWYVKHDCSYMDMISYAFRMYAPNIPSPNQIFGNAILERKKECAELSRASISHGFSAQQETAKNALFLSAQAHLPHDEAWLLMLRNFAIPLSSLFRYCLAVDGGYTEVAEKFYDAAMLQYLSNKRLYDELWSEGWIPAEFKLAARSWSSAIESS